MTEQQLIKACKKRQLKAQEMLYKQFFSYAMSVCLRYAYSREEAGEILNDAFMKVFEKIDTYQGRDSTSFKAWLRRILINTAIDYQRRNQKHQQLHTLEDVKLNDEVATALDTLQVEDLLKLMHQLPQLLRLVFNLYEIEGYSHAEIGEMLTITESSSRTYLARAKKKLREAFEIFFAEKSHERE